MATTLERAAKRFDCPVDGFQQMISGKHKLRILWNLKDGPRRYGEIRRALGETKGLKTISPRVLSRELRALTGMGLLDRKDYRVVPPKVEYNLTLLGQSLLPVISSMHRWGVEHLVRDSVLRRMGLLTQG